ncbi:MAG: GntR family galactonate operon transcriptional repressor [Halieaceae bacterium]|jgi:GntR family galactonate operon transcriptional repressor
MAGKKTARGQVAAVVDTLGFRIAANQYHQGEILPIEQELANSLDVGRNALREAVKVLSGKGLIATAPRSGTRVRPRDEWNMLDPDVLRWHADPDVATPEFMLDLIEVRRIIEPKAAELAAVRATKEDVSSILSAYEAMADSGADLEARMEADIIFHSAILKASHNQVLNHFRFAIGTYLKAHSRLGEAVSAEDESADLERHHQIAWAIATGKAKSAYSLTVEMLNLNRSHFEREE